MNKISAYDVNSKYFKDILTVALEEDLGQSWFDATSDLLFSESQETSQVKIVNKEQEPITFCGGKIIEQLFLRLDPRCQIDLHTKEGEILPSGEIALTLSGPDKALLRGERTALNFLRHLSGIATLTQKFVDKIQGYPTKILDTRKTTPGLRLLEKYAVTCGGGVNHRIGLYDALMVKDTHIDRIGGISQVLEKIPNNQPLSVIMEVRNLQELNTVLRQGLDKVDRVLLDNMGIEQLAEAVALCNGRIETEASGNLSLETIVDVAKTGVDYASVGMLTHSARSVDLSMQAIL